MKDTMYHRVLRVSAVVCAIAVLFVSGIVHESTAHLAQNTQLYLANAVGIGASVEPTELNSLTTELTKQKLALDAREQSLREREIEVNLTGQADSNDKAVFLLSGILFVLLVLIVLNYVLDYLRARERGQFLRPEQRTV